MLDLIELPDGRSFVVDRITKAQSTQILHEHEWVELDIQPDRIVLHVYQLQDGRVLVALEYGTYLLMNSMHDHDMIQNYSKSEEPDYRLCSCMYNKNPFGKDLPNHVNELIQELLQALDIQDSENKEELIRRVDSSLAVRPDYNVFRKRYFLHLVALIGQAFAEARGAQWAMELHSDSVTWEPRLLLPGKELRFIGDLSESIYDPVLRDSYVDSYPNLLTVYQCMPLESNMRPT